MLASLYPDATSALRHARGFALFGRVVPVPYHPDAMPPRIRTQNRQRPRDLGTPIDRNLALELVRVTEGASMAAARYMGRNNKEEADRAAVDSMRRSLGFVDMDGVVVIGEGEKDKAPMLYIGEHVGNGNEPTVDVAAGACPAASPPWPWPSAARCSRPTATTWRS
jgi:hypothetical protein